MKTPADHAATLDRSAPAMKHAQAGSALNDVITGFNKLQADYATLAGKWNTANPGNTVTPTSAQIKVLGAR